MLLPYHLGLWATRLQNKCTLCRLNPIDDGFLCQACNEDFDWQSKSFVVPSSGHSAELVVHFATFYNDILKTTLTAFKDQGTLETLPFLFHTLYRLAEQLQLPNDTLILPVPTTKGRLNERGFFPVGILAKYLSGLTGFGLYQGVSRPSESVRQRGLNKAERLTNLNNAFVLEYLPSSQNILIFDDVSTTGATFGAIAEVFEGYHLNLYAACIAHGNSKYYQSTNL